MAYYSMDLRKKIVRYYIETGLPHSVIAAHFGVNEKTVTYWVEKFRSCGALAFSLHPTHNELKDVLETDPLILTDHPYWSAQKLADYFVSQGRKCSQSYVLVHLRKIYDGRSYLDTPYWGKKSMARFAKRKYQQV